MTEDELKTGDGAVGLVDGTVALAVVSATARCLASVRTIVDESDESGIVSLVVGSGRRDMVSALACFFPGRCTMV